MENYEGPREPEAWQNIDAETIDGGQIRASFETNDDQDRGYPNDHASWISHYRNFADFAQSAGVTRRGVSGVAVNVTLDGEDFTETRRSAMRVKILRKSPGMSL